MFLYYIGRALQLAGMWVLLLAIVTAGSLGLIKGNLTVDGLAHDAAPTTTLSSQSSDGRATATNTLAVAS